MRRVVLRLALVMLIVALNVAVPAKAQMVCWTCSICSEFHPETDEHMEGPHFVLLGCCPEANGDPGWVQCTPDGERGCILGGGYCPPQL